MTQQLHRHRQLGRSEQKRTQMLLSARPSTARVRPTPSSAVSSVTAAAKLRGYRIRTSASHEMWHQRWASRNRLSSSPSSFLRYKATTARCRRASPTQRSSYQTRRSKSRTRSTSAIPRIASDTTSVCRQQLAAGSWLLPAHRGAAGSATVWQPTRPNNVTVSGLLIGTMKTLICKTNTDRENKSVRPDIISAMVRERGDNKGETGARNSRRNW